MILYACICRAKEGNSKSDDYIYTYNPPSDLPYEFNGRQINEMKQPAGNEDQMKSDTDDGSLSRSYYQGVMKDPFYSTGNNEPIYEKPVGMDEI